MSKKVGCPTCGKNLEETEVVTVTYCKECKSPVAMEERIGSRPLTPLDATNSIELRIGLYEIPAKRIEEERPRILDGVRWALSLDNEWNCELEYDPKFGQAYAVSFSTPVANPLPPDNYLALLKKHGVKISCGSRSSGDFEKQRQIQAVWCEAKQLLPVAADDYELFVGVVARLESIMQEIKAITDKEPEAT